MNRKLAAIAIATVVVLGARLVIWLSSHGASLVVLNPHGLIASQERQLMMVATGLMLLVVVPVIVLTLVIAWHFRSTNPRATYQPQWDSHRGLEALWWGIPCAIIAVLAVITWTSTHQLDPFRPIASATPPLTIQVVALQWKWLFIYPEQHMASVNMVELPVGRPVRFEITSDAPMNSFWIPQLAGQIYAMSGMSTQLNVVADSVGDYRGSSANLSGSGFADMNFLARAVTPAQFDAWTDQVHASGGGLDHQAYAALAHPATQAAPSTYAVAAAGLYDDIVMKYMSPSGSTHVHAEDASDDAEATP